MPLEPQPGQLIGNNIRLVSPLDEGGMGKVWIADHVTLRAKVVVKFMSEELASTTEGRSRFSREAAAAARVRSPHVVQTLDHGVTAEGIPYIVLELLEGHDLGKHIEAHGKVSPQELIQILSQLARALSKVHECGIIHRDIKPNNIFLCDAGGGEVFVKLLDFGIAKSARTDEMGIGPGAPTNTGALIGTPYYMSPEQLAGAKDVDHRSDLWSVAVVAFEALTGVKPFNATSIASLAVMVMRDQLPLPSAHDPTLPPGVDDWFTKACAREPQDRFANIREMVDAFAASFGEAAPAVLSIKPVSVQSKPSSASTNPLSSSVSPNATTLHDTAGVKTRPPTRDRAQAPSTARAIAWGASLLVLGGLIAFGAAKLASRDREATNPTQGLTPPSATVRAAGDSVPLAASSQSATASAPAVSASATPVASATTSTAPTPTPGMPIRARDAGTPGATATQPATASSKPPPPPTTTKKPPSEDDIR